jgi:transcriptional regulator of acetoin/glycerol metabolism
MDRPDHGHRRVAGWRELQNIIERGRALSEGHAVTRRDLPDQVLMLAAPRLAASTSAVPLMSGLTSSAEVPLEDAKERGLQVLEASYLRDILDRHRGNISAAAQAAGIDRKTFHRLLDKYTLR